MDCEPSNKKQKLDNLIEPSVLGLLRPHQVTAAKFILQRLLGYTDDSDEHPFALTGSILADEMGTGKVNILMFMVLLNYILLDIGSHRSALVDM